MNVPGGRALLPRQVHRAIDERRWLAGLTMTRGACNIFLGVDAFSAACVLGILGEPAICAVLTRISTPVDRRNAPGEFEVEAASVPPGDGGVGGEAGLAEDG